MYKCLEETLIVVISLFRGKGLGGKRGVLLRYNDINKVIIVGIQINNHDLPLQM